VAKFGCGGGGGGWVWGGGGGWGGWGGGVWFLSERADKERTQPALEETEQRQIIQGIGVWGGGILWVGVVGVVGVEKRK